MHLAKDHRQRTFRRSHAYSCVVELSIVRRRPPARRSSAMSHPKPSVSSGPGRVLLLLPPLLFLLLIGHSTAASCQHSKFTIVPGHTACLDRSPYAGHPSGVSAAERRSIVEYHNAVRRAPMAADMQAMAWDEELAAVAQNWANNCLFDHDGNAQRSIPGKYSVGQNLGYGYRTWEATMSAWADEVSHFVYGGKPTGVVGHYTQMVWSNTSRVGCGATYCTNLKSTLYVCNYAPGGNMAPFTYTPYAKAVSQPGDKCPAKFADGLCDCGGKTCYNGGVLDLQTCECRCSAEHFVQPLCGLKCDGAADASYCRRWPSSHCTRYYNVPYQCPNKCGWCPRAGI